MRHSAARGGRSGPQVQFNAGQAVHLQELRHMARRRTRVFNWSVFFLQFFFYNLC